jgi:hypothetical protein
LSLTKNNKVKKILPFLFCAFAKISTAQTTFVKTYEDKVNYTTMTVTNDGGIAFLSTDPSNDQMVMARLNEFGDTIWTNRYFYSYFNNDTTVSKFISQTSDSGFLIITDFYRDTLTRFNLIKINSNGTIIFTRGVDGYDGPYLGNEVYQVPGGGYIIGGFHKGLVSLLRLDSAGLYVWNKRYNASGSYGAMNITHDGGFILATNGGISNTSDIYLIKVSSAGTIQWFKQYIGADKDEVNCIFQTSDSGYVFGGSTNSFGNSSAYIVKTDSSGSQEWCRLYNAVPGYEYIRNGSQTMDGNYVFNLDIGADSIAGILKTDSAGNLLSYYGQYLPALKHRKVMQGADGSYFISGLDVAADSIMWLAKTDSAFINACLATSSPSVVTTTVSFSVTNGTTTNPITSMGTGPRLTLVYAGVNQATLCPVSMDDIDLINNSISIYPNPAHNTFTISLNGQWTVDNGKLEIYNIVGQKVYSGEIHSQLSTFNCQLNPGIYFVRVTAGEKVFTEKLVVE